MEDRDPIKDEVRENFVLKRLQERVWRIEAENKDLKAQNELLTTQYKVTIEVNSDTLRNLDSTIQECHATIEERDVTIQKLEKQLYDQKQEFDDRLEAEKHQWENRVIGLQRQNEELEEKLKTVEAFRRDKEFMEGELERLKRELQEQADTHARDSSAFERKKAMEIDQLKKDMHRKVREMREMLRAKTKDQLDQTTKRTIMENEQMVTELHFQNKESERLLNSNNKLLEENAQLKRNLAIHKDLENELARRTHVYQKLIKKMQQKEQAVAQELAVRDSHNPSKDSKDLPGDEALDDVSRELPSAMFSLEEMHRTRRELEESQSSLAMVRSEFDQYRRDYTMLTHLQDQSTRLIISALYELKNQRETEPFPPASYDASADYQFANMTPKQKEYFFRMLLEKLSRVCPPAALGLSTNRSEPSLPPIHKSQEAGHGFIWSVASHGGVPSVQSESGREVVTKSVQTETSTASEVSFKPGGLKKGFGSATALAAPGLVAGGPGGLKQWGSRSFSASRLR